MKPTFNPIGHNIDARMTADAIIKRSELLQTVYNYGAANGRPDFIKDWDMISELAERVVELVKIQEESKGT